MQYFTLPRTFHPDPGRSRQIQADPGGSKWNGRNLVGIQVNSNLIPSKNNLIIQTQIFIYSRSFQVIPGHSRWNPSKKSHSRWNPSKKKDDYFSHIPGSFPPYSRSFQVHSSHIPGSFPPHSRFIPTIFQPHSRSIPGPFPPYSSTLPSLLGYEYYILLSTTTVYSIKKELKYRYKKEGGYRKAMGARLSGTSDASGIVWAHSHHCHPPNPPRHVKT